MKKQYSVHGKFGISHHTLLNLQLLLSLTRQTMKAAGVKASHQPSVSVSVAALELAGAGCRSSPL